MTPARQLFRCLASFTAVLLGSCASPEPEPVAQTDTRAWWKGDGVEGRPRIQINLSEQRVRYYKGSELVGMSPISSGKESTGTMTGRFSIIEKDLDHRSSLFGVYHNSAGDVVVDDVDTRKDARPAGTTFLGANMRYFMRIVGGIGMHEGYLPGYPASHGCIRLPTKMAAIFFRETPLGTPVEIVGHGSLASSEEAIPIGHDTAEVLEEPEEEEDSQTKKQLRYQESEVTKPKAKTASHKTAEAKPETVKRAVVPMKKRIKKLRFGETLFLE